ncbi:MAG: ZIP family metal transporter [Bradymonadales bacterium]|nr:ZIP family metal transporter [Bradymonadales bacterium]
MTLIYVIVFALLGGIGSLLLASSVLLVKPPTMERWLPVLISFSTGTLLGAAFLGMIPHAAEQLPVTTVIQWVLVGVVVFYVLEKLLVWRHCHKHGCEVHASAGALMIVGDSVHNFVDGIVIAAAFLESTPLGVAAAISTIFHEIPQELGEFLILLKSGFSRRRALLLNAGSSLATLVGALLAYFLFSQAQALGSYMLAFAAASFLYVALADLIPSRRGKMSLQASLLELLLVLAGIAVILLVMHGH